MACACMTASWVGSLIFIDVTHDSSSRMNSEVYKNILSVNLRRNASKLIGRRFIIQQDNDPKHTANTCRQWRTSLRRKKWKVLDWPSQSPDLNPIEHAFLTSWRGESPLKQTTERGCSKSLEKPHKRMKQFGDANRSQPWCSYYKPGISYQIFSVIYSPKNVVVWCQMCCVLSSLRRLGCKIPGN